jgi:hypothetical protein
MIRRIEKWWYALGILFFNTVLSIPPLLNEETIYEFMESTMEKRLTMKEVQELFNISRATLRKWIKYENLPIIYVSDKKRYVLEKDLKCWEELKKIKKE